MRPLCALIVALAVCFFGAVSAAQAFLPSDIPTDATEPPPDGGVPTDTVGNSGTPPTLEAPEPTSIALGLIGSGALGLYLRRRGKS